MQPYVHSMFLMLLLRNVFIQYLANLFKLNMFRYTEQFIC